jgi:hypothetical protein
MKNINFIKFAIFSSFLITLSIATASTDGSCNDVKSYVHGITNYTCITTGNSGTLVIGNPVVYALPYGESISIKCTLTPQGTVGTMVNWQALGVDSSRGTPAENTLDQVPPVGEDFNINVVNPVQGSYVIFNADYLPNNTQPDSTTVICEPTGQTSTTKK